jgi:hypothetical protein
MIRLSGKHLKVPLQNVHVPITVGNIVTFSFSYTPHAKREPSSSDRVSIHRVRHDIDWFNNYISIEKRSMYCSFYIGIYLISKRSCKAQTIF